MTASLLEIIIAWLRDRREQYRPGDRVQCVFDDLIAGLQSDEHLRAYDHGELDDLLADRDDALRKQ